jgi:hypothetical protein
MRSLERPNYQLPITNAFSGTPQSPISQMKPILAQKAICEK